jgi:hypothetical protein
MRKFAISPLWGFSVVYNLDVGVTCRSVFDSLIVANSNYDPISHGLAVTLIIKSFFCNFREEVVTLAVSHKFETFRIFESGFLG